MIAQIKKVKKETVIRTTILVLAIINNGLALFNKSPLPIDDETVVNVVSFVFTTASALWAWWMNNSFTYNAIRADEFFQELKDAEKADKKEFE